MSEACTKREMGRHEEALRNLNEQALITENTTKRLEARLYGYGSDSEADCEQADEPPPSVDSEIYRAIVRLERTAKKLSDLGERLGEDLGDLKLR